MRRGSVGAMSRWFGRPSAQERRDAEAFYADLMGWRRVPRREDVGEDTRRVQMPLSHYEQWVANAVASDAGSRPAPLGPGYVRARLLGASRPGDVTIFATDLKQLDEQRTNPHGTDYRVDTAQTQLFRRASTTLMPFVETFDTTAARAASCARTFANATELLARKTFWRGRIDTLASSDRAALLDWIIGKSNFGSNSTKIDCMRRAITRASGLAAPLGRDPVRNFDAQLCIWLWKFFFLQNTTAIATLCPSTSISTFGSMRRSSVTAAQTAQPSNATQFAVKREWSTSNAAHRTAWAALSEQERQREILQTSSAPGISRHHWGTDVDIASVTPSDWLTVANLQALTRWFQTNALAFGMVQTYTDDRPGYTATTVEVGFDGYIEERWHWSYWPVAHALLEWTQVPANRTALRTRLVSAWDDVRTGSSFAATRTALGWTTGTDPFSFIQANFGSFTDNVNRFVSPPM
jgi:hypothetical protein